ncbi:hypothetical protein J7E99_18670 [Streptomyces sp. ISL-44]|uniref:hypothetical protein n=1 Tax=Streptomyces sp. ISL-44 TaxID=2819184 RepID=UPI001BE7606D|nr:hypothetical protein [Streptomyces sp. ISL-44]MBT2542685.1 hypothetical protein [Streptomyces sp. ISL-44]
MSQDCAALGGSLCIGTDVEGRAFYPRVAVGELTCDRGGDSFGFVQVFLYQ